MNVRKRRRKVTNPFENFRESRFIFYYWILIIFPTLYQRIDPNVRLQRELSLSNERGYRAIAWMWLKLLFPSSRENYALYSHICKTMYLQRVTNLYVVTIYIYIYAFCKCENKEHIYIYIYIYRVKQRKMCYVFTVR